MASILLFSLLPLADARGEPPLAKYEPASGTYIGGGAIGNDWYDYVAACGKKPAVRLTFVYFSNYSGGADPFANRKDTHADESIERMAAMGLTPMITWQPDFNRYTDNVVRIANGEFDAYIRERARECKAFGKPIFLRYCHEANGYWYSWNAHPAEVISSSRRIYDIFKQEGATNVAFVWCPVFDTWETRPIPSWRAYYPGDAYVDWVGLDVYNQDRWERNLSRMYDRFYNEFASRKPIFLCELGCSENLTVDPSFQYSPDAMNKAQWINDTFYLLKTKYPRTKGFCYFWTNAGIGAGNTWKLLGNWTYNNMTDLEIFKANMQEDRYLSYVPYKEAPTKAAPTGTKPLPAPRMPVKKQIRTIYR